MGPETRKIKTGLPRKTVESIQLIPSPACLRTEGGEVHFANPEFLSLFGLSIESVFPVNLPILNEDSSIYGNTRLIQINGPGGTTHSITEKSKVSPVTVSGKRTVICVYSDYSPPDAIQYYDTYKKLMEFSPDIILIIRRDTIVFANDAAVRFLGLTAASELTGKNVSVLSDDLSEKGLIAYLEKLNTSGNQFPAETLQKWFRLQGKDYLLELTASAVTFGGEQSVLLIARDNTEQAEAGEFLRKSNERFRVLFEESRDPILLIDQKGIFQDCNRAAYTVLGYQNKDGIVGRTPEDISPSTQLRGVPSFEAARGHIEKAYSQGYNRFEWLHQKADGTPVPFTISLTLLAYEEETYLLVHWFNLTERLLVEEELKKDNEQLATIMDTIVDGVVLVNSDGIFTYANKAAEKILDTEHNKLLGQRYQDSRWAQRDATGKSLDEKELPLTVALNYRTKVFAHEHKINSALNREKWLSVNAAPLFSPGGLFTGAIASFRDITKELQAKQSLQDSLMLSDSVLSSLQAHIAVVDNNGNIMAINSAWRKFAQENGAADSAAIAPGANYFDTCHAYTNSDDETPEVYSKIRQVLNKELPDYTKEYRCDSPSEIRWFKMTVFPLINGRGAVIAHENITGRKLIEEELKHKEALLSSFFNSSGAGMFIVDAETRILQVNRQLGKITGINEQEWVGKSLPETGYHYAEVLQRQVARVLATGESIINLELRANSPGMPLRESHWYLSYFPIRADSSAVVAVGCIITDVTELKQMQAALEDSEWKFRQLFNSSSDGVVSTTLSGRITSCNSAFEKMTGFTSDELVKMNITDITPERYHKSDRKLVREIVLLTGYSGLYEKYYLRKDGSEFPGEISMYLETDKRGKPNGVVGFIRDISERKRRNIELTESEERFRTIFENSVDALVLSTDGKITLGNTAFFNLFKFSASDRIYGTEFLSIIDKSDKERISGILNNNAATGGEGFTEGEKITYECEGVKNDGSLFTMNVRCTSYSLLGRVYVVSSMRDVTIQRKMEVRIHESEVNLRAVLNAVQDSIMLVDKTGTILSLNDMAAAQLKAVPEKLSGQNLYQLLPYEDSMRIKEQILDVIQRGRLLNQEFYQQGHWYQRIFYPVNENGTFTKVAIYMAEITERKEYEVNISSMNEQLRNHIAAKDKFFSILAHDLKSPYMGILGLMEILLDEEEKPEPDQFMQYLRDLKNALHKQYELIHHLLEWSRMQTGKKEYHPEVIDVQKAVDEVYQSLKLTAANKDVSIYRLIVPGALIWADPYMMRSILINLIGNALKFSHSGGEISVKARRKGDFVELSVQDFGTGISQEQLANLFYLTGSKSKPGTAGEKGTGLGLLITKEMAEMQGGVLTAESIEGKGSTFKVLIPVYNGEKNERNN